MGSPYLNSGETIVLTTNRVVADALAYDIMLTTERLFLIDNQNVRFEPRIIPLSAILSVQGGKTPAHDPAITLLFRPSAEGSATRPLNLVFSQSPGENRKNERDDWIRTLIQLSIARQEKDAAAAAPAGPETAGDTGLRPAVRHWVAPEKVRPLSNVAGRRTAPAPVTVIPDEVESAVPVTAPADMEHPLREPEPEGPATGLTPVRGTVPGIPAPPARVIIPQIIEELLPERTGTIPPAEHQPEPEKESEQEKLLKSVQSTIKLLKGIDLTAPESPRDKEPVEAPDTESVAHPEQPALVPSHTADQMQVATAPEPPRDMEPVEAPDTESVAQPEQPALVPSHTADQMQVTTVPASMRDEDSAAGEPDSSGPPDDGKPEPEPVSVPEPPAEIQEIAEPEVPRAVPEHAAQGTPAPDDVFRRESAAAEAPPIRHPIPPALEIRPLRTTLVYASALLLILALLAAGAVLLLPQGFGYNAGPATSTPGITPAATTVQTTQAAALSPVNTEITTPAAVPSQPSSPVPQEGVWVRVNSTAYYSGKLGNADRMQTVSGTGDTVYKVMSDDRVVQVSVQKQDNSGAMLAVGIYRNGILISTRSVTSPMGSVDLLIDPVTARPPGLTANDTLPEHAATPAGLENY